MTTHLPSEVITLTEGYIPVIDLGLGRDQSQARRTAVARTISEACSTSGFLVVVGHGVPARPVEAMYAAATEFFHQPAAAKALIPADEADPLRRGYFVQSPRHEQFYFNRLGESTLDSGGRPGDPRLYVPNKWPEQAGFRQAVLDYHAAVEELARELMRLFAIALDLPADWSDDKFDQHMSPLVLNYYPALSEPPREGEMRSQQHRDWSAVTVLYQDDAPGGLQVQDRHGNWVDVPAVNGSFVINLGRVMAMWTGDRWASTLHRVVTPPPEHSHRDRISIAFFLHPNPDVTIEPVPSCATGGSRHQPIGSAEFFLARAAKAEAKRARS